MAHESPLTLVGESGSRDSLPRNPRSPASLSSNHGAAYVVRYAIRNGRPDYYLARLILGLTPAQARAEQRRVRSEAKRTAAAMKRGRAVAS